VGLRGGCFEVTELSVAACSVAACYACKNVCEVKNPENCGLVPKEGPQSLSDCNDRAAQVALCDDLVNKVSEVTRPLSSKETSFLFFINLHSRE